MKKYYSLSVGMGVLLSVVGFTSALAATTPAMNAGAGASSGGAGVSWSNPGNIAVAGSPYATATLSTSGSNDTSEKLEATNFGFSLPANAVIGGIQVSVNRKSSGGSTQDSSVRLMKAGSAVGNNKATNTSWPTSFATASYGSGSDTWGTTWTPAEINASNFGVSFAAVNNASGNRTATVDTIQVTVTYTLDTTAPTLAEVTAVSTPGSDRTPSYRFSSTEAGTITYGGSCSSSTTTAASGTNTITFHTLADGTYSNCTIRVTDAATNVSAPLTVTTFVIDATGPALSETTPVSTPTNDTTPDYTFTSNEAGTISYFGSCSSATTSATVGVNTITLNALSEGQYALCFLRVRDAVGNNSNFLHLSTFRIDTTAPTIDSVTGSSNEATSSAGATVAYTAPMSHDAVDGDHVTSCSPASATVFPIGDTTVTCSRTDAAGNSASVQFMITVGDHTPPVLTGPTNVSSTEAVGSTGSNVTFDVSVTDAVDNSLVASCTPASGDLFSIGTTPVLCNALDSHGNLGSLNFNISVSDSTGPTLVLPADFSAEATSSSGANVTFATSANDAVDGTLTVDCGTHSSGSLFPFGTTQVDCSATDSSSNTSHGSFNITVADTTAPVIDHVADYTVEATSPAGATVTITPPMSHDAVDGDHLSSCDVATGLIAQNTPTLVTCTKTDAAGHSALASTFTVTVKDQTAPTSSVTSPASGSPHKGTITITADATDVASNVASVEFWHASTGVLIGTDTTAPYSMDWDVLTEGVADGSHDIWVRACDDAVVPNCANSAHVTVTVDNTPPVITINPYNTAQQNTDLTVTASTNEGLLNATSHTFTDNGSFDFIATDPAGNTSTTTVTITNIDKVAPIIHINGPYGLVLPSIIPYFDQGATADDDVDGNITASIVTVDSVNVMTPGTYTVTYNVTDAAGNHASPITRTVTVNPLPGGGRGGSGGGSFGGGNTGSAPASGGQVLGAETFKFTTPLKKGMTSDDVMELQDRLRTEGFFSNPTSTKYFGMATFNALKAWQKAHKLPPTGFFGPMSIAEMNK